MSPLKATVPKEVVSASTAEHFKITSNEFTERHGQDILIIKWKAYNIVDEEEVIVSTGREVIEGQDLIDFITANQATYTAVKNALYDILQSNNVLPSGTVS